MVADVKFRHPVGQPQHGGQVTAGRFTHHDKAIGIGLELRGISAHVTDRRLGILELTREVDLVRIAVLHAHNQIPRPGKVN